MYSESLGWAARIFCQDRKNSGASVIARDVGAGGAAGARAPPQLENWGAEPPQLCAWNEICTKGYSKICRNFSKKKQGCISDLADQYCICSRSA